MSTTRAETAERISWGLLAVGHLPPAAGLVSSAVVERLYDTDLDAAGHVLLQHRAALFATVVVACLAAVRDERVRLPALVVTAASVTSFLAVHAANGAPEALRRVAVVDVALLVPLVHVAARAARRHLRS